MTIYILLIGCLLAEAGTALYLWYKIDELRRVSAELAQYKRKSIERFRATVDDAYGRDRDSPHWMDEYCADCHSFCGVLAEDPVCVSCVCAKTPGNVPPGYEPRHEL